MEIETLLEQLHIESSAVGTYVLMVGATIPGTEKRGRYRVMSQEALKRLISAARELDKRLDGNEPQF